MPDGMAGFVMQVVAIFTGAGIVQLLIFLLKRRGELKALDRTSAGPLLEGQGAFIDRLTASEALARARVSLLEEKMEAMTVDFAEKMQAATYERNRMVATIATLRSDLDIALAQLEVLSARLARRGEPG